MNKRNNKEFLTISEISQLCNVSVATLKHYEKIDLLKPDYIDKNTLYRYYSISQYEKIETIRELRELGFPIVAIKEYMSDRNINNSLNVLKKQYADLDASITELSNIRNRMKKQIALIEKCCRINEFVIRKEYFHERRVLLYDSYNMHDLSTRTEIEICYAILAIEILHGRNEKAATLARARLGQYTPKHEIQKGELMKSIPFIFINNIEKKYDNMKVLPASDYCCLMHRGEARDREPYLKQILEHIKAQGYIIAGDVLHVNLVDDTISNYPEEFIFDIQVPISLPNEQNGN